ncbi:hypothetical protein DFS34DRAFT_254950 [Phlyctochytrium arcticum]|nr:hypothetical protein DFS34DRAFT_254950 [Phlyctochytrium arcticum]
MNTTQSSHLGLLMKESSTLLQAQINAVDNLQRQSHWLLEILERSTSSHVPLKSNLKGKSVSRLAKPALPSALRASSPGLRRSSFKSRTLLRGRRLSKSAVSILLGLDIIKPGEGSGEGDDAGLAEKTLGRNDVIESRSVPLKPSRDVHGGDQASNEQTRHPSQQLAKNPLPPLPPTVEPKVPEPLSEGYTPLLITKLGILPDSQFRAIWDVLMSFWYLWALFVTPVSSAFIQSPIYRNTMTGSNPFITSFFMLDTVLNLLTLRVDRESRNILTLQQSIPRYVFSVGFLVDSFTALPFEAIPTHKSAIFRLLRILRAYRLYNIVYYNSYYIWASARFKKLFLLGHGILQILECTIALLWFLHFEACLTFLYGFYSGYWTFGEHSWVLVTGPFNQYAWAILMAVGNSWPLTIEFNPVTLAECLFHSILIFTGALVCGTLTGLIQAARVGLDPPGRLYKEKVDQVNEYMMSKHLDESARRKVREFYHLKFHGKVFDEAAILEDFNPSLREQFLQELRQSEARVHCVERD